MLGKKRQDMKRNSEEWFCLERERRGEAKSSCAAEKQRWALRRDEKEMYRAVME